MIVAARGAVNYHISRGDTGPRFFLPGEFGEHQHHHDQNPVGLTSVAAAVRMVSETIGSFVMRVYEGDASTRQPVLDAPEAGVLQDGANEYATSFDTWCDISSSIELHGVGLLWKSRGKRTGKVREVYAFPVETAVIYVADDGTRIVEATINGKRLDITDDVIVIRGWSPIPAVTGVSTIGLHRRTLRGAVALEEYRGRYFDSDASPNLVVNLPGNPTKEQRDDFRSSWNDRHRGQGKEKMAITWGGITVDSLSANLKDAQVAELINLDGFQVAQMFRIYPQSLLVAGEARVLPMAEVISDLFFRFSLMHRIRRIERAVSADRELFPDPKRYARMDVSDFVRGDITTIANMIHMLVQVGAMTQNEGRAALGLPPSSEPSANKLQKTPVGGAPNPTPRVDPNPEGDPNG